MAGELRNAAAFAQDNTTGGFRDLAVAALVGKARSYLANPVPFVQAQSDFAKNVIRQAPAWRDTIAWACATDGTIYVFATAPANIEALLNTSVAAAWPALATLTQ